MSGQLVLSKRSRFSRIIRPGSCSESQKTILSSSPRSGRVGIYTKPGEILLEHHHMLPQDPYGEVHPPPLQGNGVKGSFLPRDHPFLSRQVSKSFCTIGNKVRSVWGKKVLEVYSSMNDGSAFSSIYAILDAISSSVFRSRRLIRARFAPVTAPLPIFFILSNSISGISPIMVAFFLSR